MATGVCLRDSTDGVPVRAHTHHTCDGWCVTSDSPPEALLDVRTAVLDRLLPGPLGCYVYPDDSVFHLSSLIHTRKMNLDRILAGYRRYGNSAHGDTKQRHHQMTVAANAEGDGEEDEDETSGDDDESDGSSAGDDEVAAAVVGDELWQEDDEDEDGPPPEGNASM